MDQAIPLKGEPQKGNLPELPDGFEWHVCEFPRPLIGPVEGVTQFACGHQVEDSEVVGFEDVADNLAFRND